MPENPMTQPVQPPATLTPEEARALDKHWNADPFVSSIAFSLRRQLAPGQLKELAALLTDDAEEPR